MILKSSVLTSVSHVCPIQLLCWGKEHFAAILGSYYRAAAVIVYKLCLSL